MILKTLEVPDAEAHAIAFKALEPLSEDGIS
jgi:hypothetical protein